MTPEGHEKAIVRRYLRELGAYQFWPVQTGYGAATLDCLACIGGFFVAIEVKRKGYVKSSFTVRQGVTMQSIAQCGGKVFVGDGNEIIAAMRKWLGK